jgi:hypothetical protein
MTTPNDNPFLDVSQAFTDKFHNLDRILFGYSPYLSLSESYRILDLMEVAAKSKYEGNWTTSDCYQFLRDVLGSDRLMFIDMMLRRDATEAQTEFLENRNRVNKE